MSAPSYLPVLVPALGLLVPFLIRWIENRSRLRQAQHLLQVIKTRDEIEKLLAEAEKEAILLPEKEEEQLRFYRHALETEIRGIDVLKIRLYPILISLEIIFFASAVFSGFLGIFQQLIYAQGNETLPFLEGIFSNPGMRLVLLLLCLLAALYLTYLSSMKLSMKPGKTIAREIRIFLVFNGFFFGLLFLLGLMLYLFDLLLPWF